MSYHLLAEEISIFNVLFIDSVNSKYLEDKINLLDESFIFLNEVLNKPYLVDGNDEGLLERERRLYR